MAKYLLSFFLFFINSVAFGQVTTGTIAGTMKTLTGQFLGGATITATYIPTGSLYTTVSQPNGQFTVSNLKPGGPYLLTIACAGYNKLVFSNFTIFLGAPIKMALILNGNTKLLYSVTATGYTEETMRYQGDGASTIVTLRLVQDFPAATKAFGDFVHLNPEEKPLGGYDSYNFFAVSYGGQNIKYNLFSIDGAKAISIFGLNLNGLNVTPLPYGSIQQLQIVPFPYNVTFGRFLGEDINVITKSGTNTFKAHVYSSFQNQMLIGKSVTGSVNPSFTNEDFGGSVSGPVIRNKLFFFVNAESYINSNPLGYDPTQANSGSKFDPNVLGQLANYVKKKYGFNLGSYDGINTTNSTTSVLGRLDWDINDKNKLTISNSYVNSDYFEINRSPTSLAFGNSGYTITTCTNSTVLQLTSSLSDHSSNVFRSGYSYINNVRNTSEFPSINIVDGGLTYNLGSDNSSAANSIAQKNFNIVDYFTIYKGNHTITFGSDNQLYNLRSILLQDFYGYYTYKSVTAFESNATPASYSVGYSTRGGSDKAPAVMLGGGLSVYGQDVWAPNNRFNLTYGLRVDMPVFFNSAENNEAFNTSSIAEANGLATDKMPKSIPLFSPRIGFNYDLNDDNNTRLRGGAGIFTGDVPYIWLSNQYANAGVSSIKFTGVPGGLTFNYNANQPHLGAYIPSKSAAAPAEIDLTNPNFKLPQQMKANLAVDTKLPWGLTGTLEALYSKTITDIFYKNLNLVAQASTVNLGNTIRPFYNFGYADTHYTDVIELTNTNKGYAYNLSARLTKHFLNNWFGTVGYSFGHSYSVNDGVGATSIGNWHTAYTSEDLNNPGEARSDFDMGSRVTAYFSKTFSRPQRRFIPTITVVYSGQTGLPYSYLYNYSIIGDGLSSRYVASDLVYIPTDASQFVAFTRTVNSVTTTVTPAQQLAGLQSFISQNSDLQQYVGKNTPRNAFTMPWENHFDIRFTESFYAFKKRSVIIGLYVLNASNLLDKNWGNSYYLANQEYNLFNVISGTNNPKFTFDNSKLSDIDGKLRPYSINDLNSRWRGLLDLRFDL